MITTYRKLLAPSSRTMNLCRWPVFAHDNCQDCPWRYKTKELYAILWFPWWNELMTVVVSLWKLDRLQICTLRHTMKGCKLCFRYWKSNVDCIRSLLPATVPDNWANGRGIEARATTLITGRGDNAMVKRSATNSEHISSIFFWIGGWWMNFGAEILRN
jgi:hypothetical protein